MTYYYLEILVSLIRKYRLCYNILFVSRRYNYAYAWQLSNTRFVEIYESTYDYELLLMTYDFVADKRILNMYT